MLLKHKKMLISFTFSYQDNHYDNRIYGLRVHLLPGNKHYAINMYNHRPAARTNNIFQNYCIRKNLTNLRRRERSYL